MKLKDEGFTLIELLIAIGIIAILAAAVIVAINPGQQFAQARDAARESHINTLYNGLISYQVANQGTFSGLSIPQGEENITEICNTGLENPSCVGLIDLSVLVDQNYITQIPVDPQGGVSETADGTGYFVAEGSVILVAEKAETRFVGIGVGGSETEGGEFVCGDSFTDERDGQVYTTVEIGSQCWMAENLTLGELGVDYLNGDLQYGETNNEWEDLSNIPGYTAYDNDQSNVDEYGFLYNWNAVNELNLCPSGWSVPDTSDWQDLDQYVDNNYSGEVGDQLKDSGSGWCESSPCGEVGFNALDGRRRWGWDSYSFYSDISAYWWSSNDTGDGWSGEGYRIKTDLFDNAQFEIVDSVYRSNGFSIRCLKE